MIRDTLVTEEVNATKQVITTHSTVDHQSPDLVSTLKEAQHHHHGNILAAIHFQMDENNSIEVVLMRGPAAGEGKRLAGYRLSWRA